MKKKIMIASILVAFFMAIAMFVINMNKVEYANFAEAKEKNETVQVIGKPEKNTNSVLNDNKPVFTFVLTDKQQKSEQVTYYGVKPMNFDLAEYVVVRGKYTNGKFIASEILTKCPSKYEGELTKRGGKQ